MKPSGTSKELIRRLKQGGDDESVNLLVERYGTRLLNAATILCGNDTDAEDLMIETLWRAVRSIHKFQETSSLFSWLYGILFNLNRMFWRKRSRSRLVYTDTLPETENDSVHISKNLDAADAAAHLSAAIRQISEPLQEVVMLRYYGEMSIAEIAETLKIKPGTVKSRLFSANAALRKILPEKMNFF